MYYIRTKKGGFKTNFKKEADEVFKNDGVIKIKIISFTY